MEAIDLGQPEGRAGEDAAVRTDTRRALVWPGVVFVLIAAFVAADLGADVANGVSWVHLWIELVALFIALGGVVATGVKLRDVTRRSHELNRDLERTRDNLVRSQREARDLALGVGAAIDRQFVAWELSPAECEVALLILKGLSYKQIADLRATTERTVRHQALAIFRKANVSGRAEMSAFFLEDLLLPSSLMHPAAENEASAATHGRAHRAPLAIARP